VLLNPAAWITSHPINYLILTNLPCRRRSTETALLSIHDHFINAVESRKVSSLCLLVHSDAVGIIDHSILITRLSSWFGIHGSVLNWFKSYLSSCCFSVKCENTFLPCISPLLCSPKLCSRSSTLHHVHYFSEHSHLLSVH